MRKSKVQVGRVFGRLTVVAESGKSNGSKLVDCQCSCGKTTTARQDSIATGRTTSCGCLRNERAAMNRIKHGECQLSTTEYGIWRGIKGRCLGTANPRYSGMEIHPEWLESYEAFLASVGRRPTSNHSIDRIDNERGYVPGNVRWATRKEQCRNRRSNRSLTIDGRTLSLAEWSEINNLPMQAVWERLRRGLTPKDAVTKPLRVTKRTKVI